MVLLQQRRLQPLWREWFLQGEKSRRENSLVCLNFALYATILSYWRSFFRLNVKSVKNFWIFFCAALQNLLWNYLLDNFFVNCFNFRIFFYQKGRLPEKNQKACCFFSLWKDFFHKLRKFDREAWVFLLAETVFRIP